LEKGLGYANLTFTSADRDALNMMIAKGEPGLLMVDSDFYMGGTPYMVGELHGRFPELNIAVVSWMDYPLSQAVWFIWEGAKSFANLWEGLDEFRRGLLLVREGRQYISPKVRRLIDGFDVWPKTDHLSESKRHKECLFMLCGGMKPEQIGKMLHITRKTVNNHLRKMYEIFHVGGRDEMVAFAWMNKLVTEKDIRFYYRKPKKIRLPEWAVVKKKCDRMLKRMNDEQ
jgi:DNA-binding CsgD family transcriptional regulator